MPSFDQVVGSLYEAIHPSNTQVPVFGPTNEAELAAQRGGQLRETVGKGLAGLFGMESPSDVLMSVPRMGAAVLGAGLYSGDAGAAILPKNVQLPSQTIKRLSEIFADDPAMAKYARNEYGRVGDRAYSTEIDGVDDRDYAARLVGDLQHQRSELPVGTSPKEAAMISQDVARSRLRMADLKGINDDPIQDFLYYHSPNALADYLKSTKAINPNANDWATNARMAMAPYEDALAAAGIDPKKLPINERISQGGDILKKNFFGVSMYDKLPGGGSIVELKDKKAFRKEGELMGHSVGGYAQDGGYSLGGWPVIQSGEVRVFSVRDKNGVPNLTIEVDAKNGNIIQIKKKDNSTSFNENDEKAIDAFMNKSGYGVADHPVYTGWDFATRYLPKKLQEKYSDRLKPGPKDNTEDYYDDMDVAPIDGGALDPLGRNGDWRNATPDQQLMNAVDRLARYDVELAGITPQQYVELRNGGVNPFEFALYRRLEPEAENTVEAFRYWSRQQDDMFVDDVDDMEQQAERLNAMRADWNRPVVRPGLHTNAGWFAATPEQQLEHAARDVVDMQLGNMTPELYRNIRNRGINMRDFREFAFTEMPPEMPWEEVLQNYRVDWNDIPF